jgi:putative intracellular protease/amidase
MVGLLVSDGGRRERILALRRELTEMGARVHFLGLHAAPVQGDDGKELRIDALAADVSASYYDALLVPQCRSASELVDNDDDAMALLQFFVEEHEPIGAIGNGVALLADAAVLSGIRVACPPDLDESVRDAEGIPARDSIVSERLITTGLADCSISAFAGRFADDIEAVRTRDYVDEVSDESFPASDPHSGATAVHG